jgi:hypothetical protein
MGRRNIDMSSADEILLRNIFDQTRNERLGRLSSKSGIEI